MKQKKIRYVIILVFCIAIACISVAYALLKTNLNVTGNAKIDEASWNIEFQDLSSNPAVTTTGEADISKLKLNGTVIELDVVVAKPKDSITYLFNVKNTGTIDAKISHVATPDIDALTANNLAYSFTYADGTKINVDDSLNVGDVRQLKLVVKYNENVSSLDTNPSSFSLNSSILYVQA